MHRSLVYSSSIDLQSKFSSSRSITFIRVIFNFNSFFVVDVVEFLFVSFSLVVFCEILILIEQKKAHDSECNINVISNENQSLVINWIYADHCRQTSIRKQHTIRDFFHCFFRMRISNETFVIVVYLSVVTLFLSVEDSHIYCQIMLHLACYRF